MGKGAGVRAQSHLAGTRGPIVRIRPGAAAPKPDPACRRLRRGLPAILVGNGGGGRGPPPPCGPLRSERHAEPGAQRVVGLAQGLFRGSSQLPGVIKSTEGHARFAQPSALQGIRREGEWGAAAERRSGRAEGARHLVAPPSLELDHQGPAIVRNRSRAPACGQGGPGGQRLAVPGIDSQRDRCGISLLIGVLVQPGIFEDRHRLRLR